eukprot:gnl/MRDRNA2_/MRDRNA2_116843_c0_seq1.p1 gnl/MRDRNA2_/MRDRNA2_116843_c0~~gnl/MRDRNA2_/MRDRNA2_116843_c0_seq1.p1  ORF type:complete len:415 (+),score=86.72 gnl/MRDRNA2_/MRDRNA2_116843_c0_seq1:70-1245(+)
MSSATGRLLAAAGATAGKHVFHICLRRKTVALYYDWNVMRYASDASHLVALVCVLVLASWYKSVAGVSLRSHLLLFIVAVAHGSTAFLCEQEAYLVGYKACTFTLSVLVLVAIVCSRDTYELEKDTCSMAFIMIPAIAGTVVFTEFGTATGFLWNLSFAIEAAAPLPQYILCYRSYLPPTGEGSDTHPEIQLHDHQAKPFVTVYLVTLFIYRALLGAMWLSEIPLTALEAQARVWDLESVSLAIIDLIFFIDFMVLLTARCSLFQNVVLTVDDIVLESFSKLSTALGWSSVDPLALACARCGRDDMRLAPRSNEVENAKVELAALIGNQDPAAKAMAAIKAAAQGDCDGDDGSPAAAKVTKVPEGSASEAANAAAAAILAAAQGDEESQQS